MQYKQSFLVAAGLVAYVNAHGMLIRVTGANGVEMPGLTVQDGTPRDCSSNGCGSQADSAIIRDREIESGEATPLGRTQGNGPVDASVMIANFMGNGAAPPANVGASGSVGVEDDIDMNALQRMTKRQFSLGGLLGGGNQGAKAEGPPESAVAAAAGQGATSGLPTAAEDGSVTATFRQINQDGAGPLEAMIDGTSGGTQMAAFQDAEVTQDVPGLGIQGLSLATSTEFDMTVQMPAGMTCDANVGGASNVCIMRVRNDAGAGPFGGSAAFTQTASARKRAIAYRLKKRMEIARN